MASFASSLQEYISMMIELWPSLRVGVRHLHEIEQISPDSFLPKKAYALMEQGVFIQTVGHDLWEFVMAHDVTEEDLQDYFEDILDLLMIDEELIGGSTNVGSAAHMAQNLFTTINALSNGDYQVVKAFRQNVYLQVKDQIGGNIIDRTGQDSDSSEEDQEQEEAIRTEKSEDQLEREKAERELEEEGWTVVRK